MGGCLSLEGRRQFNLRQSIFNAHTSEAASDALDRACAHQRIRSADSLMDLLTDDFRRSPPTPEELLRWTQWQSSDAMGTRRDYATTSLLMAHSALERGEGRERGAKGGEGREGEGAGAEEEGHQI